MSHDNWSMEVNILQRMKVNEERVLAELQKISDLSDKIINMMQELVELSGGEPRPPLDS